MRGKRGEREGGGCVLPTFCKRARGRERRGEREREGGEGGVVYYMLELKKTLLHVGVWVELYLDLLSFDPSIYRYNFVVIYMHDVACTCTCTCTCKL